MKSRYTGKSVIGLVALWAACSPASQASSVSFNLDLSNALADGIDYLQVTIDDEGALGDINFTVQPLPVLLPNCNFGIQKFGFNGPALSASNIVFTDAASSTGWKVANDKNISEFGTFVNQLSGKGWNRADPLTFSITGIDGDSIDSYTDLSEGGNSVFFVAHVAGFNNGGVTSAYFGGSTEVVPPTGVPVPPAAILLGSGVLGLIGKARRKL